MILSYAVNEGAAELQAEGPSAPAACSPAAGEEHAALRCALVPPGLRSGGTIEFTCILER